MSLHTPLCDELGIDYPILSVGFGMGASPELAAAVSNAGGLGVMGSSGRTDDQARDRIDLARRLTSRPFAANVLLMNQGDPEVGPRLQRRIMLLIEERVPVLVFF